MEKDDYLPLFIASNEPILIYVVDNVLVDYKINCGVDYSSSYYSLLFLKELVKNTNIKLTIPEELIKNYLAKIPKENLYFPCLSGKLFGWNNRCLAASMTIENNLVHLSNFKNIFSRDSPVCKVSQYTNELLLSPEDAFIILANICVDGCNINVPYLSTGADGFDIEFLKNKIKSYYANLGIATTALNKNFAIDYLAFLREQLRTKHFTPEQLLNLSGSLTLVNLADLPVVESFINKANTQFLDHYDSLTINQKITYATLYLQYCYIFESTLEADFLIERHETLFNRLDKDLVAKLYRPPLVETLHDDIFKTYLGRSLYSPNSKD